MKILIIRFSSIGDIVLTSPVLRAIKKKYPDTELHYLIKNNFLPVIQHNPHIDKIHVFEKNNPLLIARLKKENFTYIIDLQNNFRSICIILKLGRKSYSLNKINIRKWLMVNFKLNVLPRKHVVDRYFETVRHLNVAPDEEGLDYYIASGDEVGNESLPEGFRKGFAVFAIGGAHSTKKLPPEKIAEFAAAVSLPIIIIGGTEDKESAEKSLACFRSGYINGNKNTKEKIYNGCGIFNINQSASLIKQSLFVITHDTGMMHIAAAFKKKIISVWGNTITGFGMYPYKMPFLAIENNTLPCRPCSKIGYDECPARHFRCMRELRMDTMEVKNFLSL